ncbi:MAG TPA: MFS transporter [Alphaproteobacteria bacterium]|jgi:MFS family permease|nr:MFS transporter [Alphaproteobacteria bacterium]
MAAKGAARPGIFYGWFVVAGAFLVLFVGFGSAYAFAAFFEALEAEFSASRASISFVFSLAGFLYFSLGAASGPVADRVGPRWLACAGLAIVGLGLIGASQAATLWQVYLAYGLGVGIGVGMAYVPAVGAVQRWFVRRRGLASGLAVSGTGLGTLAVPPLAALLIDWGGWRSAYLALGVLALTVGCAAALLIEASPDRRGLGPDGDAPAAPATGPARRAGIGLAEAIKTRPFVLLYGGSFVLSLGLMIPFVHLVPYAQDAGLPRVTAVLILSLIGVGSTGGRFLLAGVADRFGRIASLAAMFAGMTLMFLWWLVAGNAWQLGLFALIFGLCYGGFVALIPAVTADYFAGPNVSGIIGAQYTSVAVGTFAGPVLAGMAFDAWHSYTVPIAFSAVCSAVATLCILALERPAEWRRRHAG